MNRKPKDKRSKKKDFDPYLFGAPRGALGATPKGKLEKDLRVPIAKMYKNAPRGMEKGGSVNTKGFKYKIPNPNEVLLLNKMVTPSGKVVEVGKKSTVKKYKKGGAAFPDLTGDGKVTRADILKGRGVKGFKGGGCVMSGRGGSYKGCK